MRLKLTFFFSIFSYTIFCQPTLPGVEVAKAAFKTKQVVPPSPEAAELGKYGNLPVSLFTGTPNISIPFFDLKGMQLSLPVSISYYAAGFKPEEIAPWTGLGWSLNAGGVITRSVRGNPDVASNYFKSPSVFDKPVSSDVFGLIDYCKDIRNGINETQPDLYYFNFMGYSGKFIVPTTANSTSTATLVDQKENSMLEIKACINCTTSSFTIRDDKGTIYTFSQLEITQMIPSDEAGQPSSIWYTFPSAWYLSSVQSIDGSEVLEFEYYSAAGAQQIYSSAIKNQADIFTKTSSSCEALNNSNPPTGNLIEQVAPETRITRKFLKRITLKRSGQTIGYADFESGINERQDLWLANFDGERILKKVKLFSRHNGIDNLVKEFEFSYGYFTGNNGTAAEKRLKLETVQEKSIETGTSHKPPYIFTYNNSNVPERYVPSIDHWGFYNQASNTTNGVKKLIPNVTLDPVHGISGTYGLGANREANFAGSSTALISKITYPTGGYTIFEFEPHVAKSEDDNVIRTSIGGVRISRIIDYSFVNKEALIKQYSYVDENGVTTGKIDTWPSYVQYSKYNHYSPGCGSICNSSANPSCFNYGSISATISTNSIYGLGSVQGSHIGYTKVTERTIGGSSSKSLGKTVYEYFIDQFTEYDDDIRNGDLLVQTSYNNAGKIIHQLTNTYSITNLGSRDIRKIVPKYLQDNKTIACKKLVNGIYQYSYYATHQSYSCDETRSIPTQYEIEDHSYNLQDKKLVEQAELTWDQVSNTYITNLKKYRYGTNHLYPIEIEQSAANSNEVLITAIKYSGDYSFTGIANGNIASRLQVMNQNHILGSVVEKIQYRQDVNGTNKRIISGQVTDSDYGFPTEIYLLETQSAIPVTSINSFQSTIDGSNSFIKDSRYKLSGIIKYGPDKNIIEQWKEDDIITSYVWGYNNSYPVAQVSGKDYSTVITNSGLQQQTIQNPPDDASLRTELLKLYQYNPDAMVTCYTYKPFIGLSSQVDQNKRNSFYEYDGLGRTVHIKDHDGNIIQNFRYNYNLGATVNSSPATLFYSLAKAGNFVRSDCSAGMKTLPQYYSIPYGKYVSAISQLDADSKAETDYTNNGQALANTQPCLYYNVTKSGTYTRNNCGTGYMGSQVLYTVPADNHSSSISQADADQKAQFDVFDNGQNHANANGTCLPAVSINIINALNTSPTVKYTNNNTGAIYSIKSFANSSSNLTIPQGMYTVTFVLTSGSYHFSINGCMSATGSTITFYNVNVTTTSCKTLNLTYYN